MATAITAAARAAVGRQHREKDARTRQLLRREGWSDAALEAVASASHAAAVVHTRDADADEQDQVVVDQTMDRTCALLSNWPFDQPEEVAYRQAQLDQLLQLTLSRYGAECAAAAAGPRHRGVDSASTESLDMIQQGSSVVIVEKLKPEGLWERGGGGALELQQPCVALLVEGRAVRETASSSGRAQPAARPSSARPAGRAPTAGALAERTASAGSRADHRPAAKAAGWARPWMRPKAHQLAVEKRQHSWDAPSPMIMSSSSSGSSTGQPSAASMGGGGRSSRPSSAISSRPSSTSSRPSSASSSRRSLRARPGARGQAGPAAKGRPPACSDKAGPGLQGPPLRAVAGTVEQLGRGWARVIPYNWAQPPYYWNRSLCRSSWAHPVHPELHRSMSGLGASKALHLAGDVRPKVATA